MSDDVRYVVGDVVVDPMTFKPIPTSPARGAVLRELSEVDDRIQEDLAHIESLKQQVRQAQDDMGRRIARADALKLALRTGRLEETESECLA